MNLLKVPYSASRKTNAGFYEGPIAGCRINYSASCSRQEKSTCEGFSLKYVLTGLEQYQVNQNRYAVEAGNYLVIGQGSEVSVKIESKKLVEEVGFFLTEDLVHDVWSTLNQTPAQLLDNGSRRATTPAFFENKFGSQRDPLGNFMAQIGASIKNNCLTDDMVDESLFYWLALELCKQQSTHIHNLEVIPAKKKSTREELYRRLIVTQEYMLENFTQPVSVTELAQTANISEFHFLRSFKAVFGESPYQYLLNLRLQLAKYLLLAGKQTITEIALSTGFKEVQAFCKLFRRAFSRGPSAYLQLYQNSNFV